MPTELKLHADLNEDEVAAVLNIAAANLIAAAASASASMKKGLTGLTLANVVIHNSETKEEGTMPVYIALITGDEAERISGLVTANLPGQPLPSAPVYVAATVVEEQLPAAPAESEPTTKVVLEPVAPDAPTVAPSKEPAPKKGEK